MSKDMTRDEALAHFGVPGMKWGVRKAAGAAGKAVGAAVDEANRPVRERDAAIAKARKALPTSKSNLEAAKTNYKANRSSEGKKAAKKALRSARAQHWSNLMTATEKTSSEKAVEEVLSFIGVQKTSGLAGRVAVYNQVTDRR